MSEEKALDALKATAQEEVDTTTTITATMAPSSHGASAFDGRPTIPCTSTEASFNNTANTSDNDHDHDNANASSTVLFSPRSTAAMALSSISTVTAAADARTRQQLTFAPVQGTSDATTLRRGSDTSTSSLGSFPIEEKAVVHGVREDASRTEPYQLYRSTSSNIGGAFGVAVAAAAAPTTTLHHSVTAIPSANSMKRPMEPQPQPQLMQLQPYPQTQPMMQQPQPTNRSSSTPRSSTSTRPKPILVPPHPNYYFMGSSSAVKVVGGAASGPQPQLLSPWTPPTWATHSAQQQSQSQHPAPVIMSTPYRTATRTTAAMPWDSSLTTPQHPGLSGYQASMPYQAAAPPPLVQVPQQQQVPRSKVSSHSQQQQPSKQPQTQELYAHHRLSLPPPPPPPPHPSVHLQHHSNNAMHHNPLATASFHHHPSYRTPLAGTASTTATTRLYNGSAAPPPLPLPNLVYPPQVVQSAVTPTPPPAHKKMKLSSGGSSSSNSRNSGSSGLVDPNQQHNQHHHQHQQQTGHHQQQQQQHPRHHHLQQQQHLQQHQQQQQQQQILQHMNSAHQTMSLPPPPPPSRPLSQQRPPDPSATKPAVLKYSRKKKSLGVLADTFLTVFASQPEATEIVIDVLSEQLDCERRRIYDVVNILESMQLVIKAGKNTYHWMGREHLTRQFALLQQEAIEHWPEQAEAAKLAGDPTGTNKDGTPCTKRDNMFISNTTPMANKSLTRLSQLFLQVFLVGIDTVNLTRASEIIHGFDAADAVGLKTKIRRLYDIANVFLAVGLLRKSENRAASTPEAKRPHFHWNFALSTQEIREVYHTKLTASQKAEKNPFDAAQAATLDRIGVTKKHVGILTVPYEHPTMSTSSEHPPSAIKSTSEPILTDPAVATRLEPNVAKSSHTVVSTISPSTHDQLSLDTPTSSTEQRADVFGGPDDSTDSPDASASPSSSASSEPGCLLRRIHEIGGAGSSRRVSMDTVVI